MNELERLKMEKKEEEQTKRSLFEIRKKSNGTGLVKEFLDNIKPD